MFVCVFVGLCVMWGWTLDKERETQRERERERERERVNTPKNGSFLTS